jgi:hypothetical protein
MGVLQAAEDLHFLPGLSKQHFTFSRYGRQEHLEGMEFFAQESVLCTINDAHTAPAQLGYNPETPAYCCTYTEVPIVHSYPTWPA